MNTSRVVFKDFGPGQNLKLRGHRYYISARKYIVMLSYTWPTNNKFHFYGIALYKSITNVSVLTCRWPAEHISLACARACVPAGVYACTHTTKHNIFSACHFSPIAQLCPILPGVTEHSGLSAQDDLHLSVCICRLPWVFFSTCVCEHV